MPTMKEFTVHLEDRPGTLGMLCRALSDKGVNIVAFQSNPDEKGKSTVRLVTDNPNATEAVLESEHTTHTETQVKRSSRTVPGRLPARPRNSVKETSTSTMPMLESSRERTRRW